MLSYIVLRLTLGIPGKVLVTFIDDSQYDSGEGAWYPE